MTVPRIGLAAGVFAALTLAAPPAGAERVYLNGVEVTGITSHTFSNATVTIDSNGDIRIDAPGYRVQVIDQAGGTTPAPAPQPAATPVYADSGRPIYTSSSSFNRPLEGTTTTTVTTTPASPLPSPTTTTLPAPAAPPRTSPLTKRYFLVTQGSGGAAVAETIRVNINGELLREIDSSAPQVIDDVSDRVALGANSVTVMSTKKPDFAVGPQSSVFQVVIGEGHVEPGGRVVIDLPIVTYTRTAADATAASRTFTLDAR